jgi:hypothetical protein
VIPFTCRLNSTGQTSPPWATPARMLRRGVMDHWKDVWDVRQRRYADIVFTRNGGDCKGDLWPIWCRRLQPHLGNQPRLASSRQRFCWLFQQGVGGGLQRRTMSLKGRGWLISYRVRSRTRPGGIGQPSLRDEQRTERRFGPTGKSRIQWARGEDWVGIEGEESVIVSSY